MSWAIAAPRGCCRRLRLPPAALLGHRSVTPCAHRERLRQCLLRRPTARRIPVPFTRRRKLTDTQWTRLQEMSRTNSPSANLWTRNKDGGAGRPHGRMPEKPADVIKKRREVINANASHFAKPPRGPDIDCCCQRNGCDWSAW